MITAEQLEASQNVIDDKLVQVRFAHIWPSMRDCLSLGREPKAFYHVVGGDYTNGSTVTIEHLHSLGLRVEVIE